LSWAYVAGCGGYAQVRFEKHFIENLHLGTGFCARSPTLPNLLPSEQGLITSLRSCRRHPWSVASSGPGGEAPPFPVSPSPPVVASTGDAAPAGSGPRVPSPPFTAGVTSSGARPLGPG